MLRLSMIWRVIVLLSALPFLSVPCASNVWGFTGEACGRYADKYELLRSCQAGFDLGFTDEVVTRVGDLQHGSGRDWYLENTDLQGETLWVDIRQLSNDEETQLAARCRLTRCRARLTGVARDRMIGITSFEILGSSPIEPYRSQL
jgi:hypothetical protein